MYVCHCRAITDGTVRDHIANGISSEADLRASSGAGARCGGCLPTLRQLLADAEMGLGLGDSPLLATPTPGDVFAA
jgi:bacterioferritin-associated ferredoxin